MEQLLGDAVQLDRFAMLLTTLFAVAGLFSGRGVYALLAYTVMQRRREIALRMALGASRHVARSILMDDAARRGRRHDRASSARRPAAILRARRLVWRPGTRSRDRRCPLFVVA
jgi:hypothetical protein